MKTNRTGVLKPEKHERMYDSVRWRKARAAFLVAHPLCAMCARVGRDTAANTVDHIRPHGGDPVLFYDRENLQSLCAPCHGIKRRQDHGGLLPGCDIDGNPLDPRHHWSTT